MEKNVIFFKIASHKSSMATVNHGKHRIPAATILVKFKIAFGPI